ncbi:MAG TPA: thioredoxin domain-containing protein [Gemmatimonadales bacterium]
MSFACNVPRVQRLAIRATLASVAVLLAGAVRLPAQDTTLNARSKGSKSAPVTVYEMADFECPYCRDFALQTFPALEKQYIATGKVRWVFINLPIPSIHPNAVPAAEFAACASREGKFWQTHDMLYSTQEKWEHLKDVSPYLLAQILPLGLNAATMQKCLQSGVAANMVRDDVAGAQKSGASSTPSFYIEGGLVEGARSLQVFQHVIDSIYAAKTKKHLG